MAQSPAPSLDELQSSEQPAWLWDGPRGRIIWANAAGVALLGGDTLFDLIDRPFDIRDPDIRTITQLSQSLERGSQHIEEFHFLTAAGELTTIKCSCSIHSLPDGRAGLLLVTERVVRTSSDADPDLMTGILEAMPIAIVVADGAGQIVFFNAAASELINESQLGDLPALLGDTEQVTALIENLKSMRTVSLLCKLQTAYGERDIRVTARLLADDEADDGLHVLLMLEDVTDRRALERALSSAQDTPVPAVPAPAPEATEQVAIDDKVDSGTKLAEISKAIVDDLKTSAPAETPEPEVILPDVPELVSKTLDKLGDAIILHRDQKFFFANASALDVLGFDSAQAVAERSELLAALKQPSGSTNRLEVTVANGTQRAFDVTTGKFPWHDGPLVQSTLRPLDDASDDFEDADAANDDEGITSTKDASELVESSLPPPVETRPAVEAPRFTLPRVELPSAKATQISPAKTALSSTRRPSSAPVESAAKPFISAGPNDPELRAILDTATDGIVTLDERGNILSFSAGAEALFGYRLAEVAGKPFAELLAKDSRTTLKDYLAALSDGGIASVFNDGREVTGIVSQGGEIALFMTIARLRSGGEAAFCAVLRDITNWKKTETQLRHDKEQAEVSNAQKTEFLARISHELRTPLNAILGFSDVMRTQRFGEIENEKYLGYANDIHKSGKYLLSLINDLLDLSKVEAGKLELNFTSVDLRGVVEECLAVMQEQATAARVLMRTSLPSDLPNVVADFRSIKQILLNLLSNAIKFTDPGGQVIVSGKLNKAGELKLKIKDTGVGMNQSELQAAMVPFKRIETPDREERSGTGLGLPLTRALTEANRARFDITSERRKGTLVEITFPTTRVLAD